MMMLTEYLEARSKAFLVTLGLLLLGLVAAIDYITSTRYVLEFSPFYVVPVAFFTWFVGKHAAVGLGLMCAAIGLATRLHSIPRLSVYWDGLVWFGLYLAAILVLSELKKLYERERSLSRLDSLTHIANRRALLESATASLSSAKRRHTTISLAYIDLDDFKQLNDSFGHEAGDKVLRTTAMTIRDALRPTDLVARIGGDEFAILLPETTRAAAERVVARVREALEKTMDERSRTVTFSIGIVTFLRPPRSVSEMLGKADQMMYRVKSDGKNRTEHQEIAA
ncbi:MAG: GGDEF domain-containing protein [Acidobacteria bacterium]|nr:MAG: GGDEF domain-containing protein [Acidobacteriota bacterium]